MHCLICKSKTYFIYSKRILNDRYNVKYFRCINCGFIQTEKPYWLKEAYSSAIIDSDTGVISRNIALSRITSILLLLLSKKESKVLDYGGGYGILTRMLRDVGVDCYWIDKYAKNVFAKGFGHKRGTKYDVVTAFELLEHLENPVKEVKDILEKYEPKVFIFSTMLHSGNPPQNWWYFAPEGGQHISLYTKKSLELLAKHFRMNLSTNNRNIHLFYKYKIPTFIMIMVSLGWPIISLILPIFFRSKTFDDRKKIVALK